MSTIPANFFVHVNPSVLAAGGNALDLSGLILSTNTRVPIGTVQEFASPDAVSDFFGSSTNEVALAEIYFKGFDNSTVKPGGLLFTQYPTASVSAYLRGGDASGLTLSQIQALNAAISVTIDGSVESATVNLSSATSFSSAAELIQIGLGIEGVQTAVVTGSIGGTFGSITSSGTVLTVGSVLTGSLQPGAAVSCTDGTNSLPGGTTIVNQLTGSPGGVGTYTLSAAATPGNLGSGTLTALSQKLKVTAVTSGTLAVGLLIEGTGIAAGTYITSIVSGTGGVGIYGIDAAHTVASETVTAFQPPVTYDSVSGAFVIASGTAGASSTITFASGALADALLLTQTTGAVLSQGSAAATPVAFMDAVVLVTQNWASFMLAFNPDNSGNANRLLFADWTNDQDKRYHFACGDIDASPTTTVPATTSLRRLITAASYSGTSVWYAGAIWDASLPAFICGAIASIDFNSPNGRTNLAYRSQEGLTATVTNETIATNLIANGYNFYGAVGAANQNFVYAYPGSISGDFLWIDSYVNQIWMNNAFQLALLVLLTQSLSIPYNAAGRGLIENALSDPINAALSFGAIRAGVTLSASQIANVNTSAGVNIATTIQQRGWYLQVLDASPTVRQARGTPPCKFWYTDGQSLQQITLASIALQ